MNGLFRELGTFRLRPRDWNDHFTELTTLRRSAKEWLSSVYRMIRSTAKLSENDIQRLKNADWERCRKLLTVGINARPELVIQAQ